MSDHDYWAECISLAAEECDLKLSAEQLACLADSCSAGHEHYGMAFYSPPSSDRINEIEREWKTKLAEKERELQAYQRNAESHMRRALRIHRDDPVSIERDGVYTHSGRTTQVL